MARVRGIISRNAVPHAFYQALDIVVPAGGNFGRLDAGDEYGPEIVLRQELALLVGQVVRLCTAFFEALPAVGGTSEAVGAAWNRLMTAVKHQSGDLFDGKLGSEVFSPYFGGFPPVFIDIDLSVPVQVLEGIPAFFQDGCRGVPQGGPIFLGNDPVTVGSGLLPLGSAGAKGKKSGRESGQRMVLNHGWNLFHLFIVMMVRK